MGQAVSLRQVQERLEELVEQRLSGGLSMSEYAEYEALIALEAELLRERHSAGVTWPPSSRY